MRVGRHLSAIRGDARVFSALLAVLEGCVLQFDSDHSDGDGASLFYFAGKSEATIASVHSSVDTADRNNMTQTILRIAIQTAWHVVYR